VDEAGIPPGEVVVEGSGADLEQQWAPRRLQRIYYFLTIRLAITWLTADSASELEMTSLAK